VFPIDLEPFILIYVFIVFLCPWAVFGSYLLRELQFLRKNDMIDWFSVTMEQWNKVNEFRRTNPESRYLYEKVKRWMLITLLCWVFGFAILAVTIGVMSANDLLIDHTKGIY